MPVSKVSAAGLRDRNSGAPAPQAQAASVSRASQRPRKAKAACAGPAARSRRISSKRSKASKTQAPHQSQTSLDAPCCPSAEAAKRLARTAASTVRRSPANAVRYSSAATRGSAPAGRVTGWGSAVELTVRVRSTRTVRRSVSRALRTPVGRSMEQTDQVRPRFDIERKQDGGHVVLNGAEREFGGLADLLIAATLEDQFEDLQMARTEFRHAVVVGCPGQLRKALGDRPAGRTRRGTQQRQQGGFDLLRSPGFEQIADGAHRLRLPDHELVLGAGQHRNRQAGELIAQSAQS